MLSLHGVYIPVSSAVVPLLPKLLVQTLGRPDRLVLFDLFRPVTAPETMRALEEQLLGLTTRARTRRHA